MAVVENGRPTEIGKGQPNGHMKSPSAPRRKQTSSVTKRGFSIVSRLLIWYTAATLLFRCPSNITELSDSSPQLCKPYLIARTHVDPYLQPYYETYAEPYVDVIRPYVHTFDEKVYSPAAKFATETYGTYGAPRLEQAKQIGLEQWEKTVQPQLDVAYVQIAKLYESSLEPHVSKVSSAASPYYDNARSNAVYIHETHLLPAYTSSKPYVQKAYTSGQDVAVNVVLPYAQQAWFSAVVFVDATLWPRLRGLYGENVEPQLVRIGERLSNYREGKKLSAAVEEVQSSIAASSVTSSISSVSASSTVGVVEEETASANSVKVAPAEPTVNSEQHIANARPVVERDLKSWQEKFAIAADKGSEDLEQHVKEIMESHTQSSVKGEGEGLVLALDRQAERELAQLKAKIISVVKSLPEEVSEQDEQNAEGEVHATLKSAGLAIRERAQALRTWHTSFEEESTRRATAASDSTLDVLDNIRDLGLQEIGMRWAWMEGITYKDWAKYHALKEQLSEWRDEVRDVALQHEALEKSKEAAHDVLSRGMSSAEDIAKELSRLKDVTKWKIRSRDSTDNFETRAIPAAVFSASRQVVQNIKEASENIVGTSQGTAESLLSQATDSASSVASDVSSKVLGTPTPAAKAAASSIKDSASSIPAVVADEASTVSSTIASKISDIKGAVVESASAISAVGEDATESVSSIASAISEAASDTPKKVWGGVAAQSVPKERKPILDDVVDNDESDGFSSKLQSIVSDAGDRYAEATKAVSDALLGPSATQGTAESIMSVAGEQYSSALAAASSVLYGEPQSPGESVASIASDKYSEAVSAASSILYGTPTPITESIDNQASTIYSQVKVAYADSVDKANSQFGAAKDVAASQYASITSAASGFTTKPTQGVLESVSSVASVKLQEGIAAASAQYSNAKAAVGPTPTPAHQQYLLDAQRRYYEAVGIAHERYSEFVSAASDAVKPVQDRVYNSASQAIYGTPTPAYQWYVDAARSQYNVASVAAVDSYSAALSSASSVAGITSKTPAQSVVDEISSKYDAVLSAASASWVSASAAASTAAYGTPAPVCQQYLDAAQSQYQAASSAAIDHYSAALASASSVAGLTSKTPAQSVVDEISSKYDAVLSAVSASWLSASVAASTAAYGTPTPAYQQYLEAAHSKYEAASSAAIDSYNAALSSASSVAGLTSKTPAQSVVDEISSKYDAVLSAASESWSSASAVASTAAYGTPAPVYQQYLDAAQSQYNAASSIASENLVAGLASASSALGVSETSPAQSVVNGLSAQYDAAVSAASANLAYASEAASTAVYGTPTGVFESAASHASQNWEALISKASEQVYGAPTPFSESVYSQAAQVTEAATAQYVALQALVSELVHGKEPDFTESVMSRLNSAYHTGYHVAMASSASSYASEAYESASSVVVAYFTPPPSLESVLSSANEQVNAAVNAASAQIYGTQAGYAEVAQSQISDAYSSAHEAVSLAVYGTPTGSVESATSAAANAYESVTAAVGDAYSEALLKASVAIYGEQKGAVESAQSRLAAAVESAQARLAGLASQVGQGASEATEAAKSNIEEFTSSVASAASEVTSKVRDEL